ncbi:MAG: hypothetical protein K2P81_15370 [Bacteriovoracaceae bacterium]|nr:hypothetical protein [Bacteriovoracaceae bacterium]
MILILSNAEAAEPQFQLGDSLSIFSDRAFRKEGGDVFEAVGNVVVISAKDTLYGESASFDRRNMTFTVDGNVRFITEDMTLYGSHLEYNAITGYAEVDNARIINPQFNVVARKILRRSENVIEAKEAEFTTCRDCTESWAIFGKKIVIYLKDRAEIHHGLAKIKGVSILYLPFMAVPLSNRKSGLLFPNISTRVGEGLALSQPVFWAIDESKDATISPSFWGKRGYGSDAEYRQRFGPNRWFEGSTRMLNDSIYLPGKNDQSVSGKNYTRYFNELEDHWMINPNWSQHIRYTSARDLDIVRDYPQYVDRKVNSSDLGFNGFIDGKGDKWSLSIQGEYGRNQLFSIADKFDRNYVQTLPRIALGTTPYSLIQSDKPLLRHIYVGVDGSFTRFRRVDSTDTNPIRDADRISANPYLAWHLFSWGPMAVKTEARWDFQRYRFPEVSESRNAEKNATLIKTEASFTMDRIFGLSYEEKIPAKELTAESLEELKDAGIGNGPKPLSKTLRESDLIGAIPSFEESFADDKIQVARHAYRHSQEFKFIHHYIANQNKSGNKDFLNQIQSNTGWFDYTDAIRSQEYLLGANTTRTIIPPNNTVEFQWNNVLIKKSPKATDWRTDQRYLRDNFSYSKTSYFNVSQGYLFDQEFEDFRQKLTRLAIQAGYIAKRWSVNMSEYFFHFNSQHIFQLSWQRDFDLINLLAAYNYNSFNQSKLNTLTAGTQFRPIDVIGLSYLKQMDLEAHQNLRTIYAVDIMPNNNCWILNLNYQESLVGFRYAFNIFFNFGDERFSRYRRDWFRVQRF